MEIEQAPNGEPKKDGLKQSLQALRERVASSAWSRIAGKLALYALGFAALALVGSGRLLAWVPPARGDLAAAVSSSPPAPTASASVAAAPTPSAEVDVDAGPSPSVEVDAGPAVTPDGKVAVNRATEADLRRLPGIGSTRAKAILALRDKLGRFKRVEDLMRIKGIGRKSMARLRPLIVID